MVFATPLIRSIAMTDPGSTSLLEVENLNVSFDTRNGLVRAVNGLSYSLNPGEVLGIVGESGSGKSVSSMALLGLVPCPPGKIEGSARFRGEDLLNMSVESLRKIRSREIAIIFQDPMTTLNPYLKVGLQLIEPLTIDPSMDKKEAFERGIEILNRVGIPDPRIRMGQYPHEFSGGMRQRICIAMALIAGPKLLIADEPTTALDVTIQAQVLDLLRELKDETGMAVILISHDLGVVSEMSDHILVMYAGRRVEEGTPSQLFENPHHPYTKGLLNSIPRLSGSVGVLQSIPGDPPDPASLPPGCPFAPRCSYVIDKCRGEYPEERAIEQRKFNCYVDIA